LKRLLLIPLVFPSLRIKKYFLDRGRCTISSDERITILKELTSRSVYFQNLVSEKKKNLSHFDNEREARRENRVNGSVFRLSSHSFISPGEYKDPVKAYIAFRQDSCLVQHDVLKGTEGGPSTNTIFFVDRVVDDLVFRRTQTLSHLVQFPHRTILVNGISQSCDMEVVNCSRLLDAQKLFLEARVESFEVTHYTKNKGLHYVFLSCEIVAPSFSTVYYLSVPPFLEREKTMFFECDSLVTQEIYDDSWFRLGSPCSDPGFPKNGVFLKYHFSSDYGPHSLDVEDVFELRVWVQYRNQRIE